VRAEIPNIGPAGIVEYHDHLLRLDRKSRWARFAAALDDRAIDAHCLRLATAGAMILGMHVDGTLRAAAEIVPHVGRRCADAAFSVEEAWRGRGIGRALVSCAIATAKADGFEELALDVLDGNEPMLCLLAQHGGIAMDPEKTTSYRISLNNRSAFEGATNELPLLRYV
jgi:GNAT superfamily N-acetyltransferase